MTAIFAWLKGKKTYLVGTASILSAVAAFLSGTLDLASTWQAVETAVLGMTIRNGIG